MQLLVGVVLAKSDRLYWKWRGVSSSQWQKLAEDWLTMLREDKADKEPELDQYIVFMNFTAPPDVQWEFVLLTVSLAKTDEELGHIAAGPIEHLLGWHGEEYIEMVEAQATIDPKFARTLTGVWQYRMSDEIWLRVKVLQEQVSDPLKQELP